MYAESFIEIIFIFFGLNYNLLNFYVYLLYFISTKVTAYLIIFFKKILKFSNHHRVIIPIFPCLKNETIFSSKLFIFVFKLHPMENKKREFPIIMFHQQTDSSVEGVGENTKLSMFWEIPIFVPRTYKRPSRKSDKKSKQSREMENFIFFQLLIFKKPLLN